MSSVSSSLSEASRTSVRYQIPTHLNVPDTIALPLFGITFHVTIRQGLIFLLGWSTAFNLWRQLAPLHLYGIPGDVLRVSLPVLLAVLTCVVALIRIADRYLEEWVVVLQRYVRQPRISVWTTVCMSVSSQATSETEESAHTPMDEEDEVPWL